MLRYSFFLLILLLAHSGIILSSCGCFFCQSCLHQITNPTPFCPRCKKPIDFNKSLDLRQKENLRKISFIFDEPETHLKKVIESIKFQKMHQKKYINFLESKIDNLIKENHTLKEQFKSNVNVTQSYDDQLSTINTVNSTAYIDLSKIKKIEPKRNTRQSNKMNQATPIMIKSNVNNLNAQTASKNCSATQYNMLNVNINNSSKNMLSPYQGKNESYYKKEISNLHTPLQADHTTTRPRSYYNNNTKLYNY